MPSINALLVAAIAVTGTAVNGHMIMKTPKPYGSPNNSPLAADGSDFPCKISTNAGAPANPMAIGAPQTLSFTGSAVHGGGSCQISLTKDMPATKSSTWMVIHSIEGGCPAKGVTGNLPAASSAPEDGAPATGGDSDTYSFTIPTGIAPGGYTLAWTWFNKIGNREMYMNCASVTVTGGSKKRDLQHPRDFTQSLNETFGIPELSERDTSFPNMFVANVPSTNCVTADSQDLQFPNPGSSVEKDGSGSLSPPTGPQCSAGPAAAGGAGGSASGSGAGAGAGAGSGSGTQALASPAAGGAPASSPAAAAPSAPASAVSAASIPAAPVASAPYANSSGAAAPAAPSGGAASPSAAAPAAAPSAPAGGAAPAAPAASAASGVCTSAGASVCSPDGKQIGTCTADMTVTFMPVADGTKCSGGMMVMAS